MIYIKPDGKRINIHAPYTDADGNRYVSLENAEVRAKFGITEIPDPVPPSDYSDDTYYRTEQDDAPYVIFTKKSDEQIAAVRWQKIKAIRDSKMLDGGCKVGDKWFHSDTHSKVQQLALLNMGAAIPAGLQWKTMDGTFVTMSQTLAQSVFAAQVAQEQAIFAHAELLNADLNADIQAGWPETYVEAVQ